MNVKDIADWISKNPVPAIITFAGVIFALVIAAIELPDHFSRAYHWIVPEYETTVELKPAVAGGDSDVISADEGIYASAQATSNKKSYDIFRCVWRLDDMPLEEHDCRRWYLRANDPAVHLDLTKDVHELTAKPDHGWWLWSPPTSEPKEFRVRPFESPHVAMQSATEPTLYLGEAANLTIVPASPGGPLLSECQWLPVGSGTIKPVSSDGCTAEYRAADRLKQPPDGFDVDITATSAVGEWTNIRARSLTVRVVAPQEHIYQYVLETSKRMQPELFDVARARILGDLNDFKARRGYLGVLPFGGAIENGCTISNSLVPLGPVDSQISTKIEELKTGPNDSAPLTEAWSRAIADYDRFKRGRDLQDPRYWLVTLVAGSDSCRPRDPKAQLGALNNAVSQKNLQDAWRRGRLITLSIVTKDLSLWRGALNSEEYRSGNAILVLSDEADIIQSVLNSVAMASSPNPGDLARACGNLNTVVASHSDERGQGRIAAVCQAITPRGR